MRSGEPASDAADSDAFLTGAWAGSTHRSGDGKKGRQGNASSRAHAMHHTSS